MTRTLASKRPFWSRCRGAIPPLGSTTTGAIALGKARQVRKFGVPNQFIIQRMPYLLKDHDTVYYGSTIKDGIVVAASGVQPCFDQVISEMVASMCQALCINEMQEVVLKQDGDTMNGESFSAPSQREAVPPTPEETSESVSLPLEEGGTVEITPEVIEALAEGQEQVRKASEEMDRASRITPGDLHKFIGSPSDQESKG